MKFSVPHKMNHVQAITQVKRMLQHARQQIAAQAEVTQEEWKGSTLHFAFTAQKQKFSGTCEVRDHSFEIDVRLPFAMRLFEGRIKREIEKQAAQMLG